MLVSGSAVCSGGARTDCVDWVGKSGERCAVEGGQAASYRRVFNAKNSYPGNIQNSDKNSATAEKVERCRPSGRASEKPTKMRAIGFGYESAMAGTEATWVSGTAVLPGPYRSNVQ